MHDSTILMTPCMSLPISTNKLLKIVTISHVLQLIMDRQLFMWGPINTYMSCENIDFMQKTLESDLCIIYLWL